MVQIIQNPYRPMPNMGDKFKEGISSLAAPFLDAITPEIKRQHLFTMQQQLHDMQFLQNLKEAGAASIGPEGNISDPQAAAKAAFLGGANARAQAQSQLSYNANKYGATSPQAANAGAGAGEAYGSTGQGTREAEANRLQVAQFQANKQAEADYRRAGLQPVEAEDANGNLVYINHASIADGSAARAGIHPKTTTDFLMTKALAPGLQGGGAAPANVAGPGVPGGVAPQLAFPGLAADAAKKLGVYVQPQDYIDYQNRKRYRSEDGGKTGIDADTGQRVYLPPGATLQDPTTVGAETRGVLLGQQANEPDPFENLDPRTSNLAVRATKVMGVPAFMSREANTVSGLFNGPEVSPERQRASQNIGVANQTIMDAAHISPTFPKFEQQRLAQLLPSTGALFGNANTEAEKIPSLVQSFQLDRARLKQLMTSVDPATRARAQEALAANTKALGVLLEGAQPRQQQGQGGAPAQGGMPVGTPSQADQPTQQPAAAPQTQAAPVRIQSDADFANLPSGATFIAPDGSTRRKP